MSVTADYIAKYSKDMIDACYNTGLFPSVMMAQGILESGNGKSELSAKYNNHFGIKDSGKWIGGTVILPTKEEVNGKSVSINAKFRTYYNSFDGFVDRVNFLKNNPRYTNAGVFKAKTPEEQAEALLKAGYATQSNYADQLIQLIKTYNLKSLDAAPADKFRTTSKTKFLAVGLLLVAIATGLYIKNAR